jgi:hypothetical protein
MEKTEPYVEELAFQHFLSRLVFLNESSPSHHNEGLFSMETSADHDVDEEAG